MTKCTHCDATWDDPADVWEAYCAETPAERRSPQGALAFGFHAALAAAPGEASWRSGADEEARDNLRLIDYIADKIGLPDTDELSRENFDAWMSATPAVGGDQFHPGKCLPDCMMLDGGKCCQGYVALYDAYWHLLRAAQPASPLREAVQQIDALARLNTTEEADIDFLIAQLGLNFDSFAVRTAVRSFRKRMIIAAAAPPGQPATVCCNGLAPVSECQCERERLAAGHAPYQRSAPASAIVTRVCVEPKQDEVVYPGVKT